MFRFSIVMALAIIDLGIALALPPVSPLAKYSSVWNNAVYLKANTAKNIAYLSKEEKELIYITNLMRMNPRLFATTVLAKYPTQSGYESLRAEGNYKTLMSTLLQLKPLPLLMPDSMAWVSASCHAYSSGVEGYDGHERINPECEQKSKFVAECCHYGNTIPLDILMSLLIDLNVPSLGHRKILLSDYSRIGLAIRPHSVYTSNTVMDFL